MAVKKKVVKMAPAPKPLTPAQKAARDKRMKADRKRWDLEAKVAHKHDVASIEAKVKALKAPLPLGLLATDLVRPYYGSETKDWREGLSIVKRIPLYFVPSFGWVVATLDISRASRGQSTDRTYGIRVDTRETVRVGNGPHVLASYEVLLRKERQEALTELLSLHNEGAVAANNIRDRISTRRAQGALRRRPFGLW